MTQLMASHEELLVPGASSQEFEDLKAHCTLTEAKVASFERDCFVYGLHSRLSQVSPFLEVMNLHGIPTTLVVRIVKLEGLLEEENRGSCQIELMLETLSREATTKLGGEDCLFSFHYYS